MTTKKKLLTALSLFALVAVVAAVSVGITFAALSGNVKSTFNITYTASNVTATMKAKYSTNSATSFTGLTPKTGSGTGDSITFVAGDATGTEKEFNPVKTTFAGPDADIYVAFSFTNQHATDDMNVTLTYDKGGDKNVEVKYAWDAAGTTYGSSQVDAGKHPTISTALPSGKAIDAQKIEHGDTAVLWIMVHITSNIADATFGGSFSFALQNAAPGSEVSSPW